MADTLTQTLPVLPLRNGVVFPNMVVTVAIESTEARNALAAAESTGGRLVMVPRTDGRYSPVGTIVTVQEVSRDQGVTALIAGVSRARIGAGSSGDNGVLWVEVDEVDPITDTTDPVLLEKMVEFRAVVTEIMHLRGVGPVAERILDVDDPGQLADLAVYSPELTLEQKVEVLETIDVSDRLDKVLGWMNQTLAELQLRTKIREDAAEAHREGPAGVPAAPTAGVIRKELGEGGDDVVGEYRARLAEAELPEKVHDAVAARDRPAGADVRAEPRAQLDPHLAGHGVRDPLGRSAPRTTSTSATPGPCSTPTTPGSTTSRSASWSTWRCASCAPSGASTATEEGRRGGAILLLVGPPGVGKTSLGESVARALGRKFVRVALGGIRDEAEIRGHRRTYVGARPGPHRPGPGRGRTMNPVFLLDEMDKVGADWRGDPSSALLEVLDPAQNHTFRDHYLEVDLDLSDVALHRHRQRGRDHPRAAARPDRGDPARRLHRRREGRPSPGTTCSPARSSAPGCAPTRSESTDGALAALIDGYTREAGVRGLERELGKLVRKVATRIAADGDEPTPVVVERRGPQGPAGPARRSTTTRPPTAPRCPAWPPGWRSPAPAATSCSSRRPPWKASPV